MAGDGTAGEVKQTGLKPMAEGGRYEFEYTWDVKNTMAKTPDNVTVDVVGAKDIRVIDMKPSKKGGTFVVTTTKATDPARYDLFISARVGEENIVSRTIVFDVAETK
jgi:hypothetical protein